MIIFAFPFFASFGIICVAVHCVSPFCAHFFTFIAFRFDNIWKCVHTKPYPWKHARAHNTKLKTCQSTKILCKMHLTSRYYYYFPYYFHLFFFFSIFLFNFIRSQKISIVFASFVHKTELHFRFLCLFIHSFLSPFSCLLSSLWNNNKLHLNSKSSSSVSLTLLNTKSCLSSFVFMPQTHVFVHSHSIL